jgi:endogenous inhibitor of DNA gyrase (YacG/DUF329 family)
VSRGLVVDLFAGGDHCASCGTPFKRRMKTQAFCSERCQAASRRVGPKERRCRVCTGTFVTQGRGDSNRWHCSRECARVSARRARLAFKRDRPDRIEAHRATARAKNERQRDTELARLWRRFPFMPHACEGCGDDRVLEIAHRPEHRRWGAWRRTKDNTPEKVWILCPTCHALLDRCGYTPEQLGIKERECAAS